MFGLNRREFLQAATIAAIELRASAAEAPAPIPEPHFPGRLYQFVWRNWELANTERMAQVVRAQPKQILEIGSSLGLPSKPVLSEDQLRRIYITVIRQNWHVLPEKQITELLGWTPERLVFTLKEDDFLDVKLGQKPACEELIYQPPTPEQRRKAEWVRTTVQRNFGASLAEPGEKLFQFVQDLSTVPTARLRDPAAHAGAGEVELSGQWTISAEDNRLRTAAARFSRYLETAMDCKLSAAPASARQIQLVTDASLDAGDGFQLDVQPSRVRIAGHDARGVMQGLYWIQDRMEQREAPLLPLGKTSRRALWNPRYLYSYFALYGDPLLETETDPFPDAYLERLARVGMNGVWIQAVLNTLAPSKTFPEFGAGSETRLKNLNALVERAAGFGMKVYLYLNEPRAQPPAFFERHPEMRGASFGGLYSMCTSVPAVREWMAATLTHTFKRAPELGGVFSITMSENHTNCFSHGGAWGDGAPNAGDCPRCTKRESWDAIAEVIRTFRDGVRASSPTADVIAWDWGWGNALARNLIPLLPKDVRSMSISEWDQPVMRGGVSSKVGEYSISVVGPGPRARANWQTAKSSGLRPMAKVPFNNTWEISAVPYIPVMNLILEHCENLTRQPVTGIMASWTCGGYASANLAAAKAYYFDSRPSQDEILKDVAIQRYGKTAAPFAIEAWKQFSKAFVEFPYGVHIYIIPTQHGPANPLRLHPTGYRAGMILCPFDDYLKWSGNYPPAIVQSQFAKLASLWSQGVQAMEQAAKHVSPGKREAARHDMAIAQTCYHHFQSVANQVEFYLLRDKPGSTGKQRMRAISSAEMDLARKQYRVARNNSIIGYEASNHYYYTPLDLVEKVLNCQQIIDELDKAV